jgi:hypothetical protein
MGIDPRNKTKRETEMKEKYYSGCQDQNQKEKQTANGNDASFVPVTSENRHTVNRVN